MGTLLFPLLWCELRYYIWPEVLVHPGVTCNQVLCFHTFPIFFLHLPPAAPLILRLTLKSKKLH